MSWLTPCASAATHVGCIHLEEQLGLEAHRDASKCGLQRVAQGNDILRVTLEGVGAHRSLLFTATPGTGCSGQAALQHHNITVAALLEVPPDLFFDPFELQRSRLDRRRTTAMVHGNFDLEACAT